jgi:HK97 family phage portal protein
VTNSALSRVLRRPNDYETISAFMLNLVHSLYREGTAFALALRNDRFEVESLHLMNPRMCSPLVAADGSDIFFRLAGNAVIDKLLGDYQLTVPQRDVLHIKLRSGRRYPHPLVGETPLVAAMQDIAVSDAFAQQQLQFLQNQARPSAVLTTDMLLDKDQAQQIRDRWNEQSKGLHQGGTPILTAGLKVIPWSTPAKDAQLACLASNSGARADITGSPLWATSRRSNDKWRRAFLRRLPAQRSHWRALNAAAVGRGCGRSPALWRRTGRRFLARAQYR